MKSKGSWKKYNEWRAILLHWARELWENVYKIGEDLKQPLQNQRMAQTHSSSMLRVKAIWAIEENVENPASSSPKNTAQVVNSSMHQNRSLHFQLWSFTPNRILNEFQFLMLSCSTTLNSSTIFHSFSLFHYHQSDICCRCASKSATSSKQLKTIYSLKVVYMRSRFVCSECVKVERLHPANQVTQSIFWLKFIHFRAIYFLANPVARSTTTANLRLDMTFVLLMVIPLWLLLMIMSFFEGSILRITLIFFTCNYTTIDVQQNSGEIKFSLNIRACPIRY